MTRELRGERPDFQSLIAAHPQHADRLRAEIRVWEGVRGMLDRLGDETPSSAAKAISGDVRPPSAAMASAAAAGTSGPPVSAPLSGIAGSDTRLSTSPTALGTSSM